jgi:fluoroquinolone transport system permease protein
MYKKLILGELKRLQKYNVTLITLLVTLMWGIMIYIIEDITLLKLLLPFIIVVDITIMPLLYAGAILYFEKTESTLVSLLVVPVKYETLILSKVFANLIHQIISTTLVLFMFIFIKSVEIPIFPIFAVMMLSITLHTLLGFVFVYISKDFTSMLTNVMVVLIIVSIPSVLYQLNVIDLTMFLRYLLLLSPFESSLSLLNQIFSYDSFALVILSVFSLIIWTVLIYSLVVKKHFKKFVQKGSGV